MPTLQRLVAAGFEMPVVVSQPDRRRGRGGATSPTPVKAAALDLGLEVTEDVDAVRAAEVDLGVVVAFGAILRADLLAAVPMVNIHFSLLPRWRGAAPVERALLAGDDSTGVCVMEVVEALDAGGVHARAEIPITADSTAPSLRHDLALLGADLLVATLQTGLGDPEPQVGEPTYARKITPDDLHLDWTRPATDLDRVVRVGGAWTTFRGKRLRVHAAAPRADEQATTSETAPPGALSTTNDVVLVVTGGGTLELTEVQPEGRARQPAGAWANGARLTPDDRLGS